MLLQIKAIDDLFLAMIGEGKKIKNLKTNLFFCLIIFKLVLDFGYWNITSLDSQIYKAEFCAWKYLNGWLWIIVLFNLIPHKSKRASTFLLYFKLLLEIVPISVIYSLGNDNFVYYNILCLSYAMCIAIVRLSGYKINFVKKEVPSLFIISSAVIVLALGIYLFQKNGFPSTQALHIDDVYKLRSSGKLVINKYFLYIMRYSVFVFLPFLLVDSLIKKRKFLAFAYAGIIFILYLYTGMKTYLFSIVFIYIMTKWSNRNNFYEEFNTLFPLGMSAIVILAKLNNVFSKVYSLFVRRVMFVSANNKFKYFDFFSKNPTIGMAGEIPGWLLNMENPYPDGIGYIISQQYYNMPKMNSNTGFMVEGYMRFGIFGMFLVFFLFAILLVLIDNVQYRTSYTYAIGMFSYMIYTLSDGYLLTLVPWLPAILFLFLYSNKSIHKYTD